MRTEGAVILREQAAPGTPGSGTGALYVKTDGKLYFKDDAGTESDLTAAAGGSAVTVQALGSDASNTSVTPAKVTGLDKAVAIGTYIFEYYIRYQTAATATGIKFDCNCSGTVTSFVWQQRWVDVSATASTATPDQDAIIAAGQVQGAFASRAKGTAGRGVLLGVDTQNADMLTIIEGLAVVTVAGNMELYSGTEVAASAAVVKAGSALRLTKVA